MAEAPTPAPVTVCLKVRFDAIPGTFDAAQIVADAKSQIQGTIIQLGFGYGEEPYGVVTDSVKIDED